MATVASTGTSALIDASEASIALDDIKTAAMAIATVGLM
jgi:hypothetical protein